MIIRIRDRRIGLPAMVLFCGFCAVPFLAFRAAADIAGAGEPNDTLESATPIAIDGFGTVQAGGFIGDGPFHLRDVDLYKVEIDDALSPPVRARLHVERRGSELDPYVRLFDPEGAELAGNDDMSFDEVDAQVDTYLLVAGTFFVGVSSSGNAYYSPLEGNTGLARTTGAYLLSITIEDAAIPVSPYEPNDDDDHVTDMGEGEFEVLGEFIGDGENGWQDRDFYHVRLTTPAIVEAVVETESIDSPLDAVVQIGRCLSGTSFWQNCLLGGNDAPDSRDARVELAIPESRDLFIMVSGRGHRQRSGNIQDPLPIGSVGTYNLRFRVTPMDIVEEDGPNDSILTSSVTTISGPDEEEIIPGFLGDGTHAHTSGDRDYYEVQLGHSAMLTAEVGAVEGSNLDPVVTVLDYVGRLIASNDNGGSGGSSRVTVPVNCTADFEEGQTVYVVVTGARQRFPNDPLVPNPEVVRFEEFRVGDGPGSTGAYTLQLSTRSQCGVEPDDAIQTATPTGIVDAGAYVCAGGRSDDGPCPLGLDVDMWSVEVATVPAFLDVTAITCGDYRHFNMRLFDSDGAEIRGLNAHSRAEFMVILDRPGTYYAAIAADDNDQYDPHVQCSGSDGYVDIDTYSITIALRQPDSPRRTLPEPEGTQDPNDGTLFATRLGASSGVIDTVDPVSGRIVQSFDSPEPVSGGAEGLAYDGSDLFFVGAGRFPNMYRMDPVTGEVIEKHILWSGSGFYSDAVMLGGELFLLDFFDNRLHVIDPVAPRLLRSMPVGAMNDIRISGGMGALSKPNRLYVADAFGSGDIHEIRPDVGTVTGTFRAGAVRPTALAGVGTRTLYAADWQGREFESIDRFGEEGVVLSLPHRIGSLGGAVATGLFGDFNEDGDIDLDDFARFQACFTGEGGDLEPGCEPGDANDDEAIDASDFAAFGQSLTGP